MESLTVVTIILFILFCISFICFALLTLIYPLTQDEIHRNHSTIFLIICGILYSIILLIDI